MATPVFAGFHSRPTAPRSAEPHKSFEGIASLRGFAKFSPKISAVKDRVGTLGPRCLEHFSADRIDFVGTGPLDRLALPRWFSFMGGLITNTLQIEVHDVEAMSPPLSIVSTFV